MTAADSLPDPVGSAPIDREALRAFAARLAPDGAGRVFHFPIRHHSPACALHLARALDEVRPRAVVIEMPADFEPLLPLLLDPATKPPVAVVSVAPRPGEGVAAPMAYWPLSSSAPEWIALRHAAAHGARVVLADLPAARRAAGDPDQDDRDGAEDEAEPAATAAPLPAPLLLTGERPLAYSDYAQALVRRLGVRDFNEAWDRLFEARAAETDWRGFFADVGVHCALARQTTPPAEMAADATLRREAHMRLAIASALADGGPVAVVTGGFHTPALVDLPTEGAPDAEGRTLPGLRLHLVRYGHRHLDRLNGYGAGMPNPRYYERLHAAIEAGACADPHLKVAEDILVDLSARLRRERPGFAPSLPALVATLAQARGLADLRDLAGPGRSEILDAVRSCLVKDEDPRFGSPVLELLHQELTGDGIGDVPRSAGSPPLVEAARTRASALGFKVDDGLERKRDLDIHRKARHRAASRFLHAMTLLDTGFARKVQGPDWARGVNTDALFETWTCAWSPLVEGRLVALSGEGDTLERACLSLLRRRIDALEAEGAGQDSGAVAAAVMEAALAGVAQEAPDLLDRLAAAIGRDASFARIVRCLGTLDVLWRGRSILGLTGAPALRPLLAACYRRAIDLMPTLAAAGDEAADANARALAQLHHLLETAAEAEAPPLYDRELFDAGVATLLGRDLPPLVAGTVGTLAHLAGRLPEGDLARLVGGMLAGAVEDPARCAAPLSGVLLVQPALLRRSGALLQAVDDALETLEEARFLELLPDLRLALSALNPDETDDLAERVAQLKGLSAPLLPAGGTDAGLDEVLANTERSRALDALIEEDGLDAWLAPTPATIREQAP